MTDSESRNVPVIHRRTLLEAIRFVVVGVMNTAITLGLIYGITAAGLSYLIANAVGYLAGFVNSFVMNRQWTFRSSGHPGKQAVLFSLVFALSYGIQFVALLVQTEWLGVPVWLAQAVSMVLYTAVNFLLNKIVTFRSI
jgi:putative flippase GtrA